MQVRRLLDLANELGFEDISSELRKICERQENGECTVVMPLVGLFSAGKTTILNELTASKALETGVEPTTATIYEIHFGSDRAHASVLFQDGIVEQVENIADLKNDELSNASVVNIFDTSTKVPSSIVLVDTPGLSSPDIKHKQVLIDFIPQADAVLLIMDVNQQLTKALSDFVKDVNLTNRPVYMVLTYCDTKTDEDVELVKKNIIESSPVSFEDIIAVSAKTGKLDQLYSLFDTIQANKVSIVQKAESVRVKSIASKMVIMIDTLLQTKKDTSLNQQLEGLEAELRKSKREIENVVATASKDITDLEKKAVRSFEDSIGEKLESIVSNRSANHDAEVRSAIGTTASIACSSFKRDVKNVLISVSKKETSFDLEGYDTSWMQMGHFSYNLQLGEMGHQYDSIIASGIKIATTAAVTMATAGTGVGVGGVLDVADTATDVLYDGDNVGSRIIGRSSSSSLLTNLVGMATDEMMGKPQRRRAIHNFVDGELMPQFKQEVGNLSERVKSDFRKRIEHGASERINQLKKTVENLERERKSNADAYMQRIIRLKEIRNEITSN